MSSWTPPEIRFETWKPVARSVPPAIELCCGMGGIAIGLRSLGIRVAKAYDSWNAAVAVYNHNAPEPVAVECDILTSVGRNRVENECKALGELDLLAAGPPCKGFSKLVNGRHHEANPHNEVLKAIPDYVASLRPRVVLIENVPDLIRHADGETFRYLINRLRAPGPRGLKYRVEFEVYDASVYGTPQARPRILILAVRDGKEHLPMPGPNLGPLYTALRRGQTVPTELESYAGILSDNWDNRIVSADQALSDLPQLGPGSDQAPRQYRSVPLTAYQQLVRKDAPDIVENTRTPAVLPATADRLLHIPPGGCARSIPEQYLNGLSRRFGSEPTPFPWTPETW